MSTTWRNTKHLGRIRRWTAGISTALRSLRGYQQLSGAQSARKTENGSASEGKGRISPRFPWEQGNLRQSAKQSNGSEHGCSSLGSFEQNLVLPRRIIPLYIGWEFSVSGVKLRGVSYSILGRTPHSILIEWDWIESSIMISKINSCMFRYSRHILWMEIKLSWWLKTWWAPQSLMVVEYIRIHVKIIFKLTKFDK